MRRGKTLVLAVLLVLLGAYVYFFELSKDDQGKSEKLLKFKDDEVAGIALVYPQREIQLQKDAQGKWKLTQPLAATADDSTVRTVIGALSAADIKRTLEKKPGAEDLKSFGLAPPAVKVSLTLKNGLTLPTLTVGAKTPVGDSTYVQRGGEPAVYLTGGALALVLEKQPNDLRDRAILAFPYDQVTRLQIKTPEQSLVLVKDAKEQWAMEAPVKKPAKAEAVAGYLAALAQLRAKTFVDDQPRELKKYGLERPGVEIALDGKDGKDVKNLATLHIGNKSGETYYARSESNPTVYAIDERFYKLLRKQPADFAAEEKKPEPKK
ncbi:MAG TPA: DUF4340 domain-containing protein [Candidatus Binatia bacterium]